MIGITSTGDFKKTDDFLKRLQRRDPYSGLARYGEMGVEALSRATPLDSSLTANSWNYRIIKGKRPGIEWYNTNVVNGTPVVILLQYGHATGTGGYVSGRDFINPAIKPIFDKIANDVWKKVRYG
jgi:hypothetical protein